MNQPDSDQQSANYAPRDLLPAAEQASLGQRLAAAMKLAGDGVSLQTHRAMREAGVGPYEGREALPVVAAPTQPRAPESTSDAAWKARNAQRLWDQNYRKFQEHGLPESIIKQRLGVRPAG